MQADNIGKLRGTATPGTDETMADSNEGFLGAAREFSNAGYGQIGLKGHTPSGRMASIAKPKFSENRDKNLQHQQRSHTMKVYIPEQSNIKNEIKEMARSLVEFYG
jgi:hypothetical protein